LQGFWPAFWLLSADKRWPPEIDVLEAFGAPNSRNEGHNYQYHYACHSTQKGGSFGAWVNTTNMVNITEGFHKYGVMWTPDTLTYYFDGDQVAQKPTPADLIDRKMYLLANLATGGNWPEDPNSDTPFPSYMQIDYIQAMSLSGVLY
jgi:beta-glucanase (GH16 family)